MRTQALLSPPVIAPLEQPFYYLENAHSVINWVLDLYGDLLTKEERLRVDQFQALPRPSQALLWRLLMRTHNYFRTSTLSYPEIGETLDDAMAPLFEDDWLDPNPEFNLSELGRLLRKDELVVVFSSLMPDLAIWSTAKKSELLVALSERFGAKAQALNLWWPDSEDHVIALCDTELFRRLQLMFFGNLRQSLSEFVVTALGYQAYEMVPLSRISRAFNSRCELEHYLALYDLREALAGEPDLNHLITAVPEAIGVDWIDNRRRRLLFDIGHQAEKQGLTELALESYRQSWNQPARIRYFRVQEKIADPTVLMDELTTALAAAGSETEKESFGRIRNRVARRIGLGNSRQSPAPGIRTFTLKLPRGANSSVEHLAAEALSGDNSQCFYVENLLFNGLFGLLCWPAIFAPVPGAFFHPFQSGPADLFREEFAPTRNALLADCLSSLDCEDYRDRILSTWRAKAGVANPLIAWNGLSAELINTALHCIPAQHLKSVFERQLSDLASFRKGFPDLVRFWPADRRYELIEVKAPGDRLQDHQRHWFAFFCEQGIPASLCQVTWSDS